MSSQSNITIDQLLGLVAGTLGHEDFARVANAVKNETALQGQLAGLEKMRIELIRSVVFDKRESAVDAFAEHLLQRVQSGDVQAKVRVDSTWMSQFSNFFTASSTSARFAYGLVAIQTVGIAWLVSGALQTGDGSSATTRSAEPDSKQLGAATGNTIFIVSFDPATPEATVRALLLALEAQIIAGPNQLGQYRIIIARNRSNLALLKLKEAIFVEQVTEIAKEAEKTDAKGGDKK